MDTGPDMKEYLLQQVEHEHNNNNILYSIFYQVRALFQPLEYRFYNEPANDNNNEILPVDEILEQMTDMETTDLKTNKFMQYVVDNVRRKQTEKINASEPHPFDNGEPIHFLKDVEDPLVGLKRIEEICSKMPAEWTIVQLCKGFCANTTYSTSKDINFTHAPIYITILRHCRSADYPTPISIRLGDGKTRDIFRKYAIVADRFKECIDIKSTDVNSKEAKEKYWHQLSDYNNFLSNCLENFKSSFYPWNFIFNGRPYPTDYMANHQQNSFKIVDNFCIAHHWESRERVLLSLAALHVNMIDAETLLEICKQLSMNKKQQEQAYALLNRLKNEFGMSTNNKSRNFPCILIVDERLDHFHWEEINVQQEFTRTKSLMCLWRLFKYYKTRIRNGYLNVSIEKGVCLVNPDKSLPKSEKRMRSFFEYWTPHWDLHFAKIPSEQEFTKEVLQSECFFYCGHGSGLQYISGKQIAKLFMNGVVFLFGCESTRMSSSGLYSEMIGAHNYYHSAMCPTIVGTLMPALDANMDAIAAEIFSRWITPKSKDILQWNKIDNISWMKYGEIKPGDKNNSEFQTIGNSVDYHNGSLCSILASIHQQVTDKKLYNTCPYVCRGLPVWNTKAEKFPI